MGIQYSLKLTALALVVLFSVNLVLAIGVSSPYWDENPLKMFPGQTKDVAFTLVNKPDADTAQAFVEMTESAGIAQLTSGTEYTVIPGETDTKVILTIKIPETTNIGETYNVGFSVKAAPPEGEGTVQISVGYDVNFPVTIVSESEVPKDQITTPEKKGIGTLVWVLIIAIVIVLVIILLLKRKR